MAGRMDAYVPKWPLMVVWLDEGFAEEFADAVELWQENEGVFRGDRNAQITVLDSDRRRVRVSEDRQASLSFSLDPEPSPTISSSELDALLAEGRRRRDEDSARWN